MLKNNSPNKIILKPKTLMGNLIIEFETKTKKDEDNVEGGTPYEINNLTVDEIHNLRKAELKKWAGVFQLNNIPGEVKKNLDTVLMQNAHELSKSFKTLRL